MTSLFKVGAKLLGLYYLVFAFFQFMAYIPVLSSPLSSSEGFSVHFAYSLVSLTAYVGIGIVLLILPVTLQRWLGVQKDNSLPVISVENGVAAGFMIVGVAHPPTSFLSASALSVFSHEKVSNSRSSP